MSKNKTIVAIILLALLLLGCDTPYHYKVRTQLVSSEELIVDYDVKVDEPIFEIPHVILIGGDDPSWFKLSFSRAGKNYIWKGNTIPIVLQFYKGSPYIVTLDRESEYVKTLFRFYRYEGDWKPITYSQFPKSVAVQNLWSHEGASPETARDVPYSIVQALKTQPVGYIYDNSRPNQ